MYLLILSSDILYKILNNMEEILRLLQENNIMLRQILTILVNMNSEDYDLKQFSINVAADIFVDNLLNNKR